MPGLSRAWLTKNPPINTGENTNLDPATRKRITAGSQSPRADSPKRPRVAMAPATNWRATTPMEEEIA